MDDEEMLDILESYDITKVRNKTSYVQFSCPFHDDHTPSAVIYLKNKRFVCFSCRRSYSIYNFIAELEGADVKDIYHRFENPHDKELLIRKIKTKIEKYYDNDKIKPQDEEIIYEESILNTFTKQYDYLLNRGFTKDALDYYEVGYYAPREVVTLPFRNRKKQLIGVYARKTQPTKYMKYYPLIPKEGYPKYNNLYGLDKVEGDTVLLVEGNLDVIRIYQAGYKLGAAIQSTNLTKAHEKTLSRHYNKIILGLDPDKAGISASEDIFNRMSGKIKIEFFNYNNLTKDIGDMTNAEIKFGVENSTLIGKWSQHE